MQHTRFFFPALLLALFFSACKKDSLQNNLAGTPGNTSIAEKLKDSTLLYTKDIYLWNDKIPASFNARTFADPAAIMTAIRQYAIEPGFSSAVDRWSFAMERQQWDNISTGKSDDFGLTVFFRQEGDLRVKAVEKASPAGLAGIQRGWRIMAINGGANPTTANASAIVKDVYQSSSTAFTFQKPDGGSVNLTLNAAQYREQPVVLDSVYTVGGKKIGYFVFGSFLGDTADIYQNFDRIFNRFTAQGVQEIVVDLRYNGGGYVNVAERLANYLAPSAADGNVMLAQKFNTNYTRFNSTDLFRKRGNLNLGRIFFIVSNSTASASELLINSLKPYMEVILAGPGKTHGKPVGYFPIPVGNWYIFPVSFLTVNKNGDGHYYNGMALNSQTADGLDKNWGDLSEASFGSVINYITTGSFRVAAQGQRTAGAETSVAVVAGNNVLDATTFKGAVETRKPN